MAIITVGIERAKNEFQAPPRLQCYPCRAFISRDTSHLPSSIWTSMSRVGFCMFNGLDPEIIIADEDRACALIADWYLLHREGGSDTDPAVERVLERLCGAK